MGAGDGFERLVELMARLRGPEGCPWDRDQTPQTLRPFILEEAYELVEAINASDPSAVREELGDLLLEVLFVSQIAGERSQFTICDVLDSLEDKMVRRHPHVFGPRRAGSPEEALARWEEIKDSEKADQGPPQSQVPLALPALTRATKLSAQAAKSGLDWPSADAVVEKIGEEIAELERARGRADRISIEEEVGDLLFAVANLARHLGIDAELALQTANRKFEKRFRHVQHRLKEASHSGPAPSPEDIDALWNEAKKMP